MVEEGAFRPQIKIDFIEDTLEDVPERGWEESRIVERIPLPTHLPRKLDLSILPDNVQKSGAIDSLIRQNEDLMARLNVALRRHSILEEQAGKFENTLKQLQDRNEALADQVLVYREKDRLQGNTRKTSERQIQELKEQVSLLEIRYAEYYAVSREKLDYLSTKVERTTRRLARYTTYRTRINRLGKDRKKEAEQHIQNLAHENQKLTSRLQQETLSLSELRVKLGEAVDHIQRQSVETESNQRQLVDNYENQFSDLREQVKLSSSRILELEELLTDQERLFQDKITVENQLVATQRSFSDAKSQYEENLNQLQEGLAEFRREAKERSLEVDRLNKEMGLIKSQRDELSTSKRELEDRIESLECLWRDTNQQHEQLKERHQALQNLNQQLSTSLIEQRREVNLLKEQRDANHLQTSTKIRELEGQVRYLGTTAVRTTEQQQKGSEVEPSQRRELVQRIEKLISEIQSGFAPASVGKTGDQAQEDSYQDPPPI